MQCFIYFFIVIAMSLATDVSIYNPSDYYNALPDTEVEPLFNFASPWNFGYESSDQFYMEIKYINKSPNVTANVTYEPGVGLYGELSKKKTTGENVLVYYRPLNGPDAFINLQLYTSNGLCASIRLAEGKLLSTLRQKKSKQKYRRQDYCFIKKQPCVLQVDLKDLICKDKSTRTTSILKPPILFDDNCSNEKKNNDNYSTKVKYENGKDERCFSIIKKDKTNHKFTSIFLELETVAYKCNITIFEGGSVNSKQETYSEYTYSNKCSSSQFCTMEVRLENECTDTYIVTSSERPVTSKNPGPVRDSIASISTSPHEYMETTTNRQNENNNNSPEKQSQHSQNDLLIYVMPVVIGMCIIILVIYISVKKYRRRITDPVDAIELNTYATTNEILYADLSLMHGDSRPPRHKEEATYAKIIGVMKPVNANVKNK